MITLADIDWRIEDGEKCFSCKAPLQINTRVIAISEIEIEDSPKKTAYNDIQERC